MMPDLPHVVNDMAVIDQDLVGCRAFVGGEGRPAGDQDEKTGNCQINRYASDIHRILTIMPQMIMHNQSSDDRPK